MSDLEHNFLNLKTNKNDVILVSVSVVLTIKELGIVVATVTTVLSV
jgi:hypothetical protein